MTKVSLREKIKKILSIKSTKTDIWTLDDSIAWKNFCLKTPGFLHLAKKIPSDITLDEISLKIIDDLYKGLKAKKESTVSSNITKPKTDLVEGQVKKNKKKKK